ncbi:GGDEF domain-containing protein [Colwellia sp. RSH04]|uniref:GGDEF domain-containing protein n=1 Tax=Colwellia sp. RSH04 TaxID=2305464 RepID=UPI000E57440F|nr:GGDEF domain-containing protein [Colwellia sp. RSH04]RHW76855.1 GGDEF domain-containing protein [Colwellia sp. RSH04]
MKYHDSIHEAEQIMARTIEQLNQWGLPVNPINYAVGYEYSKQNTPKLSKCINDQLLISSSLNGFFMESLYKSHVLEQSKFRFDIISDLHKLLSTTQKNSQQSSHSADKLISDFDTSIPQLLSQDKAEVIQAVEALEAATQAFKKQQEQLNKQLQIAQRVNQKLNDELTIAKQSVDLDPVTGLFNKEAIIRHINAWLKQDSQPVMIAILVKVNDFEKFSQEYGLLLSDVILNKVANKVASYVDESGLSSRISFDEFLLFVPKISIDTANEISKKISLGVEKLRFVSAKSKVTLPQITIDYAIDNISLSESLSVITTHLRNKLP